jgi:hypothetical protein
MIPQLRTAMSRRIWITAVVFFASHLYAQAPAVQLWAVSDGVRVNPVTGKVYEARSDIHRDYPKGDFRPPTWYGRRN